MFDLIPMPYRIAIAALAVLIAYSGGFYTAHHYDALRQQADLAKAEQAVVRTVEKQDAITAQVSQASAEKQVEIQTVTQTIVKEVPVYVTRQADARCTIPRGFVRLHNAAASGMPPVPAAAGQSDDSASGVDLSAVASTVASNYGTCAAVRQELTDLQGWVRDQAARQ